MKKQWFDLRDLVLLLGACLFVGGIARIPWFAIGKFLPFIVAGAALVWYALKGMEETR